MSWKTRRRGTARQIGKKFPVAGKPKKLPRLSYSLEGLRKTKAEAGRMFGVRIHAKETEVGQQWILSKGLGKSRKWFTEDVDASNEELLNIAKNFDKEWEARVGQYQVTPKSERASEYFARRYPMMFRGGGKIRQLTTVAKRGTIIRHKTIGTIVKITGSDKDGFIVRIIKEGDGTAPKGKIYAVGLPYKEVDKWEIVR